MTVSSVLLLGLLGLFIPLAGVQTAPALTKLQGFVYSAFCGFPFSAECFSRKRVSVYQVLSSVSSPSVLKPVSSSPFSLPVSSPFLSHSRGPGLSWVPSPCCGLEALQALIRVLTMMPVSRLCACLLPIIGNYLKHSLHIFLKLFKARWASQPSSLHRG